MEREIVLTLSVFPRIKLTQMSSRLTSIWALVLLMTSIQFGCRKNATGPSASAGASSKSVEVTGTVKEDDPTDFTQADESVQIGGVNLATTLTYTINAYALEKNGTQTLVGSATASTNQFSLKVNAPKGSYLVLKLSRSDGKLFATVLPAIFKDLTAKTIIDGTSSIAAKMMEIASAKAVAGDADSTKAFAVSAFRIADLMQVASSVYLTVQKQKEENIKANSINLTSLTRQMTQESNKALSTLVAQGKSPSVVVEQVAQAESSSMFSTYAESIPISVLAYRVNHGIETSTPYEIGNNVLKKAAETDTSFAPTYAAYQIQSTLYRQAESPSIAAQQQSTIESRYDTVYADCVSSAALAGTACYSSNYTPPTAPSDPPPSSPPPPSDDSPTGEPSGSGTGGGSGNTAPTYTASSITFFDGDSDTGQISGTLSIGKATDETNITDYVLYWGSNSTTKLAGQAAIATRAKTGVNIQHGFSGNTAIPSGATHFLVYTKNSVGEMATGISQAITDAQPSGGNPPMSSVVSLCFSDSNTTQGSITGDLHINSVSPSTSSDISHFVVYWANDSNAFTVVNPFMTIARDATYWDGPNLQYVVPVPANTAVPAGSTRFIVRTKNANGENQSLVWAAINDNSGGPATTCGSQF
jgi:hypothetical protein